MEVSPMFDKVVLALRLVQGELRNVPKGASGFNWRYAPLDDVIDEVKRVANKHQLVYTHDITYHADPVATVSSQMSLLHESGQFLTFEKVMPVSQGTKQTLTHAVGAAQTYARRTQLLEAFGIAQTDEPDADKDGADAAFEEDVNRAHRSTPPKPKSKPKSQAQSGQALMDQLKEGTRDD